MSESSSPDEPSPTSAADASMGMGMSNTQPRTIDMVAQIVINRYRELSPFDRNRLRESFIERLIRRLRRRDADIEAITAAIEELETTRLRHRRTLSDVLQLDASLTFSSASSAETNAAAFQSGVTRADNEQLIADAANEAIADAGVTDRVASVTAGDATTVRVGLSRDDGGNSGGSSGGSGGGGLSGTETAVSVCVVFLGAILTVVVTIRYKREHRNAQKRRSISPVVRTLQVQPAGEKTKDSTAWAEWTSRPPPPFALPTVNAAVRCGDHTEATEA